MLHDLTSRIISDSTVGLAMRRRDAIGFVVLAALGLTLSDAGRHVALAAK